MRILLSLAVVLSLCGTLAGAETAARAASGGAKIKFLSPDLDATLKSPEKTTAPPEASITDRPKSPEAVSLPESAPVPTEVAPARSESLEDDTSSRRRRAPAAPTASQPAPAEANIELEPETAPIAPPAHADVSVPPNYIRQSQDNPFDVQPLRPDEAARVLKDAGLTGSVPETPATEDAEATIAENAKLKIEEIRDNALRSSDAMRLEPLREFAAAARETSEPAADALDEPAGHEPAGHEPALAVKGEPTPARRGSPDPAETADRQVSPAVEPGQTESDFQIPNAVSPSDRHERHRTMLRMVRMLGLQQHQATFAAAELELANEDEFDAGSEFAIGAPEEAAPGLAVDASEAPAPQNSADAPEEALACDSDASSETPAPEADDGFEFGVPTPAAPLPSDQTPTLARREPLVSEDAATEAPDSAEAPTVAQRGSPNPARHGSPDPARHGSLDPAETATPARRGSPDPAETPDRQVSPPAPPTLGAPTPESTAQAAPPAPSPAGPFGEIGPKLADRSLSFHAEPAPAAAVVDAPAPPSLIADDTGPQLPENDPVPNIVENAKQETHTLTDSPDKISSALDDEAEEATPEPEPSVAEIEPPQPIEIPAEIPMLTESGDSQLESLAETDSPLEPRPLVPQEASATATATPTETAQPEPSVPSEPQPLLHANPGVASNLAAPETQDESSESQTAQPADIGGSSTVPTTPARTTINENSLSRLRVAVRESRLLRTNLDVHSAASLDSEICEVVHFSAREVVLVGKKPGTTRVDFQCGTDQRTQASYMVTVGSDPTSTVRAGSEYSKLENLIRELYPACEVRLEPNGNSLIVSGTAKDRQEAIAIITMIRRMRTIPVVDELTVQ
jgi:hypothetical protein